MVALRSQGNWRWEGPLGENAEAKEKRCARALYSLKPSPKNVVVRSFAALSCPARISLKNKCLTFFKNV